MDVKGLIMQYIVISNYLDIYINTWSYTNIFLSRSNAKGIIVFLLYPCIIDSNPLG